MQRQQQNGKPSDVILKKLFSGFTPQKPPDPVNDSKGTINRLEMDNMKNTRALNNIQTKLDQYDKDNLTESQIASIKPLLSEREELKSKITFNNNSILLLKKTINVHETTKDTHAIVSNIKNLNIATKELNTLQDIGNVDDIMTDLGGIMEDNNEFKEALTTNPITGGQNDDNDLLNSFMNEDKVVIKQKEVISKPIVNINSNKRPLLVNTTKNDSFNQSFYDDKLYNELDDIKIPQSRLKVSVYNKKNSTTNNIENNLGWI